MQCSFVEHRNYKVIYRRYASLFFLVGIDNDEVKSFASQCLSCCTALILCIIVNIGIVKLSDFCALSCQEFNLRIIA